LFFAKNTKNITKKGAKIKKFTDNVVTDPSKFQQKIHFIDGHHDKLPFFCRHLFILTIPFINHLSTV